MTQSQPPGAPSSGNGETRDDGAQVLPIDPSVVRAAVRNGMRRYAESRRAGIPEFVGRNFGLAGAVELHGRALGWDLLRAPANMALSLPYVGLQAAAAVGRGVGLRRAGDWLARRSLLLTTDVAREVEWRLFSEFLELPYLQDYRGGQRRVERDALADAILSDPELSAVMRAMLQGLGRRADDPVFRDWLGDAMSVYTGSRVAASDLREV